VTPRILIAGIGNMFLGDDGFGCEVARRLAARPMPEEVRVVDFGIRGLDVAFALMDGPDLAILVDAVPRGETPGTLFVLEPDLARIEEELPAVVNGHGMDPMTVLRLVRTMGGTIRRMLVVGCEPGDLGGDEGFVGLSAPVEAAVDQAVLMVESIAGGAYG
jgi:hydrogenase maturation protease